MSDDAPTIRLGTSGLVVGPISYGCWRFAGADLDAARAKIVTALDCGFTLIDTADIYGFDGVDGFGDAEALLGRVLADAPELRDRMVLATKGGIRPGVPYDWSADYLRAACEDSLRRLGVDVIDLYQLHRPDVLTHPAEVAAALTDLRERGLVREVGLSNVTPSQLEMVQAHLDVPLATTQPEFSIWHSDPVRDGTFDQCLTHSITPLAWSPLGGGRVGGDGQGVGDDPVTEVLDRIARRHEVDTTAVALAFVLAHPAAPVPILGTQRLDRIEAARVALDVTLDRSEWYELYQAGTGEMLP
jgi:predicted oxidoreductase